MYLIKEKREKQKKNSNTQEMKTAQSFYNGHVGESGDSLLRNGRLFSLTKILGVECWCKHNQTCKSKREKQILRYVPKKLLSTSEISFFL